MNRNEYVGKTVKFLIYMLEQNNYMKKYPGEKMRRLEQAYRVANIGQRIANDEMLDVEDVMMACLLQDVSLGLPTYNGIELPDHYRNSADVARPFLIDIGCEYDEIDSICFAISALDYGDIRHFSRSDEIFVQTIGDCNKIELFDPCRLFETLKWKKYDEMLLSEKEEYVKHVLADLELNMYRELATSSACLMWFKRMEFYKTYYTALLDQIKESYLFYFIV